MEEVFIPGEIRKFFSDREGKTLLIKGPPGSGKTSFSFTLLLELKGNGVYLSTRVDPHTLHSQIPWLRELLPEESIIDATQSERQRPTSSKEMPMIRALKYADVPDFLKNVYQRTEKLESPLVIIDSWDAVVAQTGFHEPREREKLEHNLCDFARKTNTKIVFIVEFVEQRPLDYLVDAVIITESQMYEEQRIRRMELRKLRGYPIKQALYLFSLHNGMFKCFPALRGLEIQSPKTPSPLPDIDEGRLSTGIRDLDLLLGGYGGLTLFQGDYAPYELLLLPFIINSLNLGKTLIFNTPKESLIRRVSPFVPREVLSRLQVLPVSDLGEWRKSGEELASARSIWFFDLDGVKGGGVSRAREMISTLLERGAFVLTFVPEGRERGDGLESRAAACLVLKMLYGVPSLYGNPPNTGIHAVEVKTSSGFPEIWLTPVV